MIESLNINNVDVCTKLACLLWPESDYLELYNEFSNMLESNIDECFLYLEIGLIKEYLGFIHVSLRNDYVEGSSSSPVAYIEGIYVDDQNRRKGIAQLLVDSASTWGRDKGCSELASDCLLSNNLSIDFHKGIGFDEANRIVCFIKSI